MFAGECLSAYRHQARRRRVPQRISRSSGDISTCSTAGEWHRFEAVLILTPAPGKGYWCCHLCRGNRIVDMLNDECQSPEKGV
jgi:hypothetical protein